MALKESHEKLKYHSSKLSSSSSSADTLSNTNNNLTHRRIRVESEESSHDGDGDDGLSTQRMTINHDETSSQHLDGSRGSELRQLQDSLTRFFTPSNRRRSRVAQSSFSLDQLDDRSNSVDNVDNDAFKNEESDDEKESREATASAVTIVNTVLNGVVVGGSGVREKSKSTKKREWQQHQQHRNMTNTNSVSDGKRLTKRDHLRPLTVAVDDQTSIKIDAGVPSSGSASGSRTTQSSWKSHHSSLTVSPHRRNDVLYDALSPYFSASSEKRRTFSKGEYAQLSGVRRRGRSGDSSSAQEQISPTSQWSIERARVSPDRHSSFESISAVVTSSAAATELMIAAAQQRNGGVDHEQVLVDDEFSTPTTTEQRSSSINGTVKSSTRHRKSAALVVSECDGAASAVSSSTARYRRSSIDLIIDESIKTDIKSSNHKLFITTSGGACASASNKQQRKSLSSSNDRTRSSSATGAAVVANAAKRLRSSGSSSSATAAAAKSSRRISNSNQNQDGNRESNNRTSSTPSPPKFCSSTPSSSHKDVNVNISSTSIDSNSASLTPSSAKRIRTPKLPHTPPISASHLKPDLMMDHHHHHHYSCADDDSGVRHSSSTATASKSTGATTKRSSASSALSISPNNNKSRLSTRKRSNEAANCLIRKAKAKSRSVGIMPSTPKRANPQQIIKNSSRNTMKSVRQTSVTSGAARRGLRFAAVQNDSGLENMKRGGCLAAVESSSVARRLSSSSSMSISPNKQQQRSGNNIRHKAGASAELLCYTPEKPIVASASDTELFERACSMARRKVEDVATTTNGDVSLLERSSCSSSANRSHKADESVIGSSNNVNWQTVAEEGTAGSCGDGAKLDNASSSRHPRLECIMIGGYRIDTWYSAPYPEEYSRLTTLHICEFCMQYMKTETAFRRHLLKCSLRHPPGNEIYRKENISVFEVDGSVSLMYCQNICLLAKLFLDHKTLYYDVEPFLFYILTRNDENGFHFVGYFSKEKYSAQKYNLSCIMTLPCYQMQGFGRFLIDFSFLLSRREGMMGTPERPLSDLGRISYFNYWLSAILEHLHDSLDANHPKKITIKSIARSTGISIFDIIETIEPLGMIEKEDAQNIICLNYSMIENHWKRAKSSRSRLWIDETKLKWEPREYTPYSPMKEGRSPVATAVNRRASLSPKRSPVDTRSLHHVTAAVADKKVTGGTYRKYSKAGSGRAVGARKRLMFESNNASRSCGGSRLANSVKRQVDKKNISSANDSEDDDDDNDNDSNLQHQQQQSPSSVAKNSCKEQSRLRRRSNPDTSDDNDSSDDEEHHDGGHERFRGSKRLGSRQRSKDGTSIGKTGGRTRRSDAHASNKNDNKKNKISSAIASHKFTDNNGIVAKSSTTTALLSQQQQQQRRRLRRKRHYSMNKTKKLRSQSRRRRSSYRDSTSTSSLTSSSSSPASSSLSNNDSDEDDENDRSFADASVVGCNKVKLPTKRSPQKRRKRRRVAKTVAAPTTAIKAASAIDLRRRVSSSRESSVDTVETVAMLDGDAAVIEDLGYDQSQNISSAFDGSIIHSNLNAESSIPSKMQEEERTQPQPSSCATVDGAVDVGTAEIERWTSSTTSVKSASKGMVAATGSSSSSSSSSTSSSSSSSSSPRSISSGIATSTSVQCFNAPSVAAVGAATAQSSFNENNICGTEPKGFEHTFMNDGRQVTKNEVITSEQAKTKESFDDVDGEDRRSLSRCNIELSNDELLPPRLEAANDDNMPSLWHRQQPEVSSPEPNMMEVSFTGGSTEALLLERRDAAVSADNDMDVDDNNSRASSLSPTEMPQLRVSTAAGCGTGTGTESVYDGGEDEDAPPRLSPNFAPTEVADEGSLSENDETTPLQWRVDERVNNAAILTTATASTTTSVTTTTITTTMDNARCATKRYSDNNDNNDANNNPAKSSNNQLLLFNTSSVPPHLSAAIMKSPLSKQQQMPLHHKTSTSVNNCNSDENNHNNSINKTNITRQNNSNGHKNSNNSKNNSNSKTTNNNTCEMVNLGGDAGSEGSDAETSNDAATAAAGLDDSSLEVNRRRRMAAASTHSDRRLDGTAQSGCSGAVRTVCEIATVDTEATTAALDRPPKAPQMLTQPLDDHDHEILMSSCSFSGVGAGADMSSMASYTSSNNANTTNVTNKQSSQLTASQNSASVATIICGQQQQQQHSSITSVNNCNGDVLSVVDNNITGSIVDNNNITSSQQYVVSSSSCSLQQQCNTPAAPATSSLSSTIQSHHHHHHHTDICGNKSPESHIYLNVVANEISSETLNNDSSSSNNANNNINNDNNNTPTVRSNAASTLRLSSSTQQHLHETTNLVSAKMNYGNISLSTANGSHCDETSLSSASGYQLQQQSLPSSNLNLLPSTSTSTTSMPLVGACSVSTLQRASPSSPLSSNQAQPQIMTTATTAATAVVTTNSTATSNSNSNSVTVTTTTAMKISPGVGATAAAASSTAVPLLSRGSVMLTANFSQQLQHQQLMNNHQHQRLHQQQSIVPQRRNASKKETNRLSKQQQQQQQNVVASSSASSSQQRMLLSSAAGRSTAAVVSTGAINPYMLNAAAAASIHHQLGAAAGAGIVHPHSAQSHHGQHLAHSSHTPQQQQTAYYPTSYGGAAISSHFDSTAHSFYTATGSIATPFGAANSTTAVNGVVAAAAGGVAANNSYHHQSSVAAGTASSYHMNNMRNTATNNASNNTIKSHPLAAVRNSFSTYNTYQNSIQASRSGAMLVDADAAQSANAIGSAPTMMDAAGLQNGTIAGQNTAATAAPWRYPSTAAAATTASSFASNGFMMDAFGGGSVAHSNSAGNSGQFALSNQLYQQPYYSYFVPMMRNDIN